MAGTDLKAERKDLYAPKLGVFVDIVVPPTLHVGSYDDEAPIPPRLHDEYLPQHSLKPTGLHHEIYLSDPRRTAPAKLRTILRQPVATAPRP